MKLFRIYKICGDIECVIQWRIVIEIAGRGPRLSVGPTIISLYIRTIPFDNINYTSHSHLEIGIVYISSVHSTSLPSSLARPRLSLSLPGSIQNCIRSNLTVNTFRGVSRNAVGERVNACRKPDL
jgi:hypothetical protein